MSTKAQKVFAKATSLGDTPEGDVFQEGVERMGPMYYIDQNGQKRTMHGDIPFGERAEPEHETAHTSPPPPEPEPQHEQWGYSGPEEPKQYAPPPPTSDPGPTTHRSPPPEGARYWDDRVDLARTKSEIPKRHPYSSDPYWDALAQTYPNIR